ncbi:hypothetical protein [Burkholderia sp. SRS-25]|uniref:hypothetical protein n=1 Tax=Burkholderia sp. SRS-25 TaxID=2094190 RepID=UPI00104B8883|nr:hypothetical protein [Burkholderia sp. SRS-25]TCW64261.1 hypothetical protein C5O79_32395 [Burkholderia sp. SRS-25]
MPLTSTQVGVIGENLLVNAVMKASDGRLSPFRPIADDDGLDVLFFDKETGSSVAMQLKCRTVTTRKRRSDERGNVAYFQVRKATFNEARRAYLLAALFNPQLSEFVTTWLVPMEELRHIARDASDKWVIQPSKAEDSADKYTRFRCQTAEQLAQKIVNVCEAMARC